MDRDWTESRNESIMEELWASVIYKGVGSPNGEPGLVQTSPLGLNERREGGRMAVLMKQDVICPCQLWKFN